MKHLTRAALALCAVLLCSCGMFGGGDGAKKKKSSKPDSERTLGERLNKPNLDKESPFQKYLADSSRGNAASRYQTQGHRAKNFDATKQADVVKWHKVDYAKGLTQTRDGSQFFNAAGKGDRSASRTFDTTMNREGGNMAREGSSFAREGGRVFSTDSALPANQQVGKPPKIIENRAMENGGKTYSEDQVKQLLGRP